MDARALRWPDLVWSHFSRPPLGGFDERVAAAERAGFSGIGLYTGEYARLRDEEGRSAHDLGRVLDDHGVVVAEVEAISGWWSDEGPEAERCRVAEALAYELADALGVRYLQVIAGNGHGLGPEVAERFGALCDRAAAHGLLVGIEWLPFTDVATAADAACIVTAADRPNGGYCIDLWHHVRGATTDDMLRDLDPDRIFAVQLDDGPLVPTDADLDYKSDCLVHRLPPGEGEFDVVSFLHLLRELGVTAPLSAEVCSAELWAAPVEVAARRAADGLRSCLAAL